MMKPPGAGSVSPHPDPVRSDREASQRQLELFAERGGVEPRHSPQTAASSAHAPAVDALSDDDLLELIPNAGPSNVEAVCSEVVSRSLQAGVPALEALWQRFSGFGIEKPLREQLAVVDTLPRLGGTDARAALRRIVLWKGLPASLLPAALQAAASAGLALPAPFVAPLLDHEDAAVRSTAFALAASANVPADRLHASLFDWPAGRSRARPRDGPRPRHRWREPRQRARVARDQPLGGALRSQNDDGDDARGSGASAVNELPCRASCGTVRHPFGESHVRSGKAR